MATTYDINMKQYNGTDYDTLYPKTVDSQTLIGDSNFPTSSFVSAASSDPTVDEILAGLVNFDNYSDDMVTRLYNNNFPAMTIYTGKTLPTASGWTLSGSMYYVDIAITGLTTSHKAYLSPVITTADVDTGSAQQEAWNAIDYAQTIAGAIRIYSSAPGDVAVTFVAAVWI